MSRKTLNEELIKLADEHEELIVISCDSTEQSKLTDFKRAHPKKLMQLGSGISSGILVSLGLSIEGKKPILIAPAKNLTSGALETAANYPYKITIVGTKTGLCERGEHSTNNSCDTKITQIHPADSIETRKAIRASIVGNRTTYIKLSEAEEKVTSEKTPFVLGRAEMLRIGHDATIVANGRMVSEAIRAANKLAEEGIDCTVMNMHSIPVDKRSVIASGKITRCVVCAEEQNPKTGMGSSIALALAGEGIQLKTMGIEKAEGVGSFKELLKINKISADRIAREVKKMIVNKNKKVLSDLKAQKRLLCASKPEESFKLKSGENIHTIADLQRALFNMPKPVFEHHCNQEKNDFSNWARSSLMEEELASLLELATTREGMLSKISRWLG